MSRFPLRRGSAGDGLPRKGVVQTLSSEGWSWIKKDGQGSRKSGNRIPFVMGDVVTKVTASCHVTLFGVCVCGGVRDAWKNGG